MTSIIQRYSTRMRPSWHPADLSRSIRVSIPRQTTITRWIGWVGLFCSKVCSPCVFDCSFITFQMISPALKYQIFQISILLVRAAEKAVASFPRVQEHRCSRCSLVLSRPRYCLYHFHYYCLVCQEAYPTHRETKVRTHS